MVGIQKNIHVVDVTSQGQGKKSTDPSATSSTVKEVEGVHRLPSGLTQEELHVPSDEKDVYAYYYINKVRILSFMGEREHILMLYILI